MRKVEPVKESAIGTAAAFAAAQQIASAEALDHTGKSEPVTEGRTGQSGMARTGSRRVSPPRGPPRH